MVTEISSVGDQEPFQSARDEFSTLGGNDDANGGNTGFSVFVLGRFGHLDIERHVVANVRRFVEIERLRHPLGAGTGEFVAEKPGKQARDEHAVGGRFFQALFHREFRIEMGGIAVARQHRVIAHHRFAQEHAESFFEADFDLGEGGVLDDQFDFLAGFGGFRPRGLIELLRDCERARYVREPGFRP